MLYYIILYYIILYYIMLYYILISLLCHVISHYGGMAYSFRPEIITMATVVRKINVEGVEPYRSRGQ